MRVPVPMATVPGVGSMALAELQPTIATCTPLFVRSATRFELASGKYMFPSRISPMITTRSVPLLWRSGEPPERHRVRFFFNSSLTDVHRIWRSPAHKPALLAPVGVRVLAYVVRSVNVYCFCRDCWNVVKHLDVVDRLAESSLHDVHGLIRLIVHDKRNTRVIGGSVRTGGVRTASALGRIVRVSLRKCWKDHARPEK